MQFQIFKRLLYLLAVTFSVPLLCLPAAIQATGSNTVCELGDCTSPGILYPGESIPSTPYEFTYTFANTDTFVVQGMYSASGNAPDISFSATATFVGNSTHTASQADVLSVDLLQYFGYNDDPDGTYSYTATLAQTDVASGSYVTSQLSFDNEDIGMLTYSGLGVSTQSANADLTGLSNPALADFDYTFHLAAGSPAIPEPGEAGLWTVGFVVLALALLRRRKLTSLL